MEVLPIEILSRIFTQLNICDWIRCVHVCQSWRRLVAIAVADVFDEMYIEDTTYPSYLNSICLFPSIRSVHLHLANDACLLSSLENLSKCHLSKLEIADIALVDPEGLYVMLEHLADNLTSLALTDMKGAFVDITRVLQACPSLCQLSYTIRISNSNSCSTVPCSRPPASCYSLVSLQLQTESRCLFDPTLVLKNCPNLVALTIDNTPLSPTDILTWCPQLELLHMGKKTHCIGMDHPALQLRTKDIKRQQGLRYLYLAENPLFIQGIRQILHAHSQTLQILHLPPSSLIQHPAAAAVSAPAAIEPHRLPDFSSLKILSTVTVQDPHALITLINACPSLEELHILDFGSLSFSVIDTISRFRQSLVKLSFRAQFGYDACSVVKRNSLLSMLPQLTCLTTLVFDYCSLFDGDTAVYLLSRIASLQDLTLGSIAPSDHMKFDALQHLSRLRRLRLRHFLFPSLLHKEQNSWPTLEQLCLIECYISTPDWDPDSILPKMPRLNSFILSKCQGNAMHVIQKYKRWGKVELILQ